MSWMLPSTSSVASVLSHVLSVLSSLVCPCPWDPVFLNQTVWVLDWISGGMHICGVENEKYRVILKTKSYAATCSTSERRYSWTSVCVNVYKEFCLCVRFVCTVSALCVGAAHRKQKCTGAIRILEDDVTRDDLPTLLAHPIYSTMMMQVCMYLNI